jgi:hypothetical protein
MRAFRLNAVGWFFQVLGTLFLLLDSIRVSIRLPREGVRLGDPPQIDSWIYHWASSIGFGCPLIGFAVCGIALWLSRPKNSSRLNTPSEILRPLTENIHKSSSIWPLFVFGGFVFAVWGAYWYLVIANIPANIPNDNSGWQTRGLFGDMFGAVNALFSGLAFAGIIYAIVLQRKELSLQWQEQTRLFAEQNATLERTTRQEFIEKLVDAFDTKKIYDALRLLHDKSRPYGDLESFRKVFEDKIEEANRARRRVKHLMAWLGNLLDRQVLTEQDVFFVALPYKLYKKDNGEDGHLLTVEKDLLKETGNEPLYKARTDSVWYAERCAELYRNYLKSHLEKFGAQESV